MGKVNTLLTERLKKTDSSSKMAAMARQSANGELTSFSGVFSMSELSPEEKTKIEDILKAYAIQSETVDQDLISLVSITSEVKAITNQAALLHGERIKKAHTILTRYRDGAFTAWLMAAYGNRQTPYNLMQYYEFCEAMPKTLRLQIEAMPRQAIYTLASREGPIDKKRNLVENYNGQTKVELLNLIRELFPLDNDDKRNVNRGDIIIATLKRARRELKAAKPSLTPAQKEMVKELIGELNDLVHTKAR